MFEEHAALDAFEEMNLGGQVGNRTRAEKFCDVVRALGAGAEKRNQVMFKAKLSWPVLESYLGTLEAQGSVAVAVSRGKKAYRLTKKGTKLLTGILAVSFF